MIYHIYNIFYFNIVYIYNKKNIKKLKLYLYIRINIYI